MGSVDAVAMAISRFMDLAFGPKSLALSYTSLILVGDVMTMGSVGPKGIAPVRRHFRDEIETHKDQLMSHH